MKTVTDLLPLVKANKNTYYNLSRKDIVMFKDLYTYLKKHKDKYINCLLFEAQITTIRNTYTGYLLKFKTMELIAYNIKH